MNFQRIGHHVRAICAALAMLCACSPVQEPPSPEELPLWQETRQDLWWPAASIHADNTPHGTPEWARTVWDDLVQVDPSAPEEFRPFYIMKSGGLSPLTDAFFDEIRERTEAGFRVVYTLSLEDAGPEDLRAEVAEMERRDALPWGVGLWNEIEFGQAISPDEFRDILVDAQLPDELESLHHEFGVMVSPPGFSSFSNIVLNGYGTVVNELFAGRDGVFIKVHSYGHIRPRYWVELDLRQRVQDAVGIPDVIVLLEETANSFVGEHQEPHAGVSDEQGAEFFRAAMYASMQSGIASCHFMLYHKWHHHNDISHPVNGKLRRDQAQIVLDAVRSSGDIAPTGALDLENPKGREIDPDEWR